MGLDNEMERKRKQKESLLSFKENLMMSIYRAKEFINYNNEKNEAVQDLIQSKLDKIILSDDVCKDMDPKKLVEAKNIILQLTKAQTGKDDIYSDTLNITIPFWETLVTDYLSDNTWNEYLAIEKYQDFPFYSLICSLPLVNDLSPKQIKDIIFYFIEHDVIYSNVKKFNDVITEEKLKKEFWYYSGDLEELNKMILASKRIYNSFIKDGAIGKTDEIKFLREDLLQLGIDEETAGKVCYVVDKEIKKFERNKVLESPICGLNISKKEENIITDKDYKKIRKEINQYFDLHEMKLKQSLTYEEMLYYASLMLKIEVPITDIRTFMLRAYQEMNKNQTQEVNPISNYVQIYNKLMFYSAKMDFREELNTLKEYLEQMVICSSEEYEEWKKMFSSDLNEMLLKLPNKFEYEICEARKIK